MAVDSVDVVELNNWYTNLNEAYAVTIANNKKRRVVGRFNSLTEAQQLAAAYDQAMEVRIFRQCQRGLWEVIQ